MGYYGDYRDEYEKGRRDERSHHPDYEHDRYSHSGRDEAYFKGREYEHDEMRREQDRAEERREDERRERDHQREISEQNRAEEEAYWLSQQGPQQPDQSYPEPTEEMPY